LFFDVDKLYVSEKQPRGSKPVFLDADVLVASVGSGDMLLTERMHVLSMLWDDGVCAATLPFDHPAESDQVRLSLSLATLFATTRDLVTS
jgi:hypothetical protein